MPALRIERVRGPTLSHPGQDVTPLARVIRLSWPGGRIEWRRPVAVEVRRGNHVLQIPIRDTTRRAQVAIVASGLALYIFGILTKQIVQRRFA
jgi:hypothetical protein